MTSGDKQYKKISARSCNLKWRFNKIYWLEAIETHLSIFGYK